MLYVSRTPVKVELMEDRRIILLTGNKILFSHLDFIEEYLSMPLVGANPKNFIHPTESLQTLVQTETTIEIFYCDWKTQIKLVKVIILTNEKIDSIYYDQKSGWHIFGSMLQYEPARVTFHQPYPAAPPDTICECKVAKNRYRLSPEQLMKSQRGQNFAEIKWRDRMMVLKNTNYYLSMEGEQSLDKTRDILCINATYILVVNKYEVLYMIMEPIVKIFSNNLIVSKAEDGKFTTVLKLEDRGFTNLGTVYSHHGETIAAFIYPQQLALLNYETNSVTIITIGLVRNQSSPRNANLSKKGPTYQLKNSISRIVEQPHEEASQYIQQQERQENENMETAKEVPNSDQNFWTRTDKIQNSNKNGNKTKDTSQEKKNPEPPSKPVIRDIEVSDQIKANSLNEEDSEVLSRSAIDNDRDSEQLEVDFDNSFKEKKGKQTGKKDIVRRRNVKSPKIARQKSNNAQKNLKELCGESQLQISQEKSDKNNSISKISRSLSAISQKSRTHNISVSNQQESFTDDPLVETPAFGSDNNLGFGSGGGNLWGNFQNNWDAVVSNKISERGEMEEIEEEAEEKEKMKKSSSVISKKVEYFLNGRDPTKQLVESIESSSYCKLIEKVLEQNPSKFEQITEEFLLNILEEPEANLFFADHIRTYSPEFTKDKIKRIFHELLDKEIYRPMLTKVLQQFKLSEVPAEILTFPADFINVVKVLYKDIYISDLLNPSEVTIEYLLESYFNMTSFSQEIIVIEDEEIEIAHPRNMLNVLLYLNEVFNLHISIILQVYCAKLLQYNCLQIISKLLEQDVFQICEVPRTLLDEPIVARFNELLRQSVENASYLWQIVPFLSDDLVDEFRIRLATITQLNANSIVFDVEKLISIKESPAYLYEFMESIIEQNSSNLMNLKFDSVYRSLYWIQEGEKLMNYTNEYVDLMKQLAEKFISKRYIYDAFRVLENIAPQIRTSFVGRLLYKYLDGKLLNRLVKVGEYHANLESVFPEYFQSRDTDFRKVPRDHLQNPKVSECFSCSWEKFKAIYDTYLSGPSELQYLTFCKVNLVFQIFSALDEQKKQKFNQFLSDIDPHLRVQLKTMNELDQSLNPKGITGIKFYQKIGEDLESNAGTSMMIREDYLLDIDDNNKKKMYKSMTILDHYNEVNQRRVSRANSDKKNSFEIDENDELMRLKLLVDYKEIKNCLEEIYETQAASIFVKATYLVDSQKIKLHRIDTFRHIYGKNIEFQLSKIIPFDTFLIEDETEAFEKSRKRIKGELNVRNFWLIYIIIEMMFGKGSNICQMFMEELVQNFAKDSASELVRDILRTVGHTIPSKFIKSIRIQAKQNKLHQTFQQLTKYIESHRF